VTIAAAWIAVFSPLVGAALTPLLSRIHAKARDLGAVTFSFVSAAAALSLLPLLFRAERLPIESHLVWLRAPIEIGFGVLIDPLSIVLVNVVAVVSFVIMVYCTGYMRGDPGQTRFWMWMNGFIGSMVLLVLSNNLLFLFVGWKLVGVCSYGLIGFYYQDQREYWIGGPTPNAFVSPSQAGLKALVVTGAGDMLMLGGILILYFYSGSLNLLELYRTAPVWIPEMAAAPGMLILVSVLLLAGPVGKSAQFPLHEWLPEAMAGPGPVSALIHAATMVKSGVYLVARLVPLFYYAYWVAGAEQASWFFYLTAWVGAFTAFVAATQGMVALELKKVLAYSTVSQIGYMMLGMGVAGFTPGLLIDGYTSSIFHLVSHALFKACLFLCAGTIIHAVHSIYIHDMGAARKYLPLTWGFTLVASLSLIGLWPFPGFWSKDAVLLATLEASLPLFLLALVTAGMTAFYTVRFLGVVFFGQESEHLLRVKEESGHLNDGELSMRASAGVLAVVIVGAGLFGPTVEHVLHDGFAASLPSVSGALAAEEGEASSHGVVPLLSILVLVIGALPAYYLFIARRVAPATLLERHSVLQALYTFFWKRWFMDAFYRRVFVQGTMRVAAAVASIEDGWDRLVHRELPFMLTDKLQQTTRRLRTEKEELFYNVSYVLVLFILFLTFFMAGTSGN
jgi:NADH-quinone oxidoreductase subunit L